MDLLSTLIWVSIAGLLLLSIFFALNLLKLFFRKSFRSNIHAPALGTMFDEIRNFTTLLDYHTQLSLTCKTYRLVFPSHSEIYTTDPANIEHILKTNFSIYQKGQTNHEIMEDLLGDGIFAVDGEKWRHQRKLASFEFSNKVLRDFSSDVFRMKAVELGEKVSEAASTNQAIDMQVRVKINELMIEQLLALLPLIQPQLDMLMNSTLESIFVVGFGTDLKSLMGSNEKVKAFAKAFNDSNELVFRRYIDLFWKVKRFFNMGSEASLRRNIKAIDELVYELIRCRRKNPSTHSKRGDILSRFLEASENEPEKITDKYLRDIILNFMIAGRDTTAVTLSWFIYMICKNPRIEEKIEQELSEAVSEEARSMGEFAYAVTNIVDKLHYVHAALTETLRLHPAVPLDGKQCCADDTLPDGFKIRKGDGMLYPTYAMGRMTWLWGEDAHIFRPERWLENGAFRPESPFKFTSFQILNVLGKCREAGYHLASGFVQIVDAGAITTPLHAESSHLK